MHGNTDIVGLSRFVLCQLLACPDIAAEFAHPNVRHLYKPGEMQWIVFKFCYNIYSDRHRLHNLGCKEKIVLNSVQVLEPQIISVFMQSAHM